MDHFIDLLRGKNTMLSMWCRTQDSHSVTPLCNVVQRGYAQLCHCTSVPLRLNTDESRLSRAAARRIGTIGRLSCSIHPWLSDVQVPIYAGHGYVSRQQRVFLNVKFKSAKKCQIHFRGLSRLLNLANKVRNRSVSTISTGVCVTKFLQLSHAGHRTFATRSAVILIWVLWD
jgi:hypothetical protein